MVSALGQRKTSRVENALRSTVSKVKKDFLNGAKHHNTGTLLLFKAVTGIHSKVSSDYAQEPARRKDKPNKNF
ncbi:hypothetical protein RRG08_001942 [Elysia crispata]|uniref:Uncharacterized protein n=1 Tax=Elysia crispata TaxID=231223 RepID=A0AAE1ECL8_9GAST|nr:hypothetical protein RRG08_001942 [Elysia crispata]